MNEPIKLYHDNKLIALFFKSSLEITDTIFYTDDHLPFQVGFQKKAKGALLSPRKLTVQKTINIKSVSEFLLVQSGKIKINLHSGDKIFASKILKTGDSVLILETGHSVEYLEESKILIIKQGPFSNILHEST